MTQHSQAAVSAVRLANPLVKLLAQLQTSFAKTKKDLKKQLIPSLSDNDIDREDKTNAAYL